MYALKLDDLAGFYHELALHDVTQYPLCPSKPSCITSNKTIRTHSDGTRYVHGDFTLSCFGQNGLGCYTRHGLDGLTNVSQTGC